MRDGTHNWTFLLLVFTAVATAPAVTAAEPTSTPQQGPFDCRYVAHPIGAGQAESADRRTTIFPPGDLFRPLLADRKEPRFYGGVHRIQLSDALAEQADRTGFFSGITATGETFGLWTRRTTDTCDGIQLNIYGAVYSQFRFDPLALLNADYQIGFPLSVRRGPFSARLRLYHQSSHLGDQFLLENPDFQRINLSFEVLDFLVSFDTTRWRIYAGAGILFRIDPPDLDRFVAQAGAELRLDDWAWQTFSPTVRWIPVAAVDVTSYQTRRWGPTISAMVGTELTTSHRDEHKLQRVRLLAGLLYGYIPFGQFFADRRLTSLGLETQFEF